MVETPPKNTAPELDVENEHRRNEALAAECNRGFQEAVNGMASLIQTEKAKSYDWGFRNGRNQSCPRCEARPKPIDRDVYDPVTRFCR